MIERSMIFRYAPRQTGLAGRVRIAGGEFSGAAGARPTLLHERVKRKFRARHAGPQQLRQHLRGIGKGDLKIKRYVEEA